MFAIPLTLHILAGNTTTTRDIFFATRTHTLLLPQGASVTLTAPPSIPLVLAQPDLPLSVLAGLDAATLERETRSRFLLLRNEQLSVQEAVLKPFPHG